MRACQQEEGTPWRKGEKGEGSRVDGKIRKVEKGRRGDQSNPKVRWQSQLSVGGKNERDKEIGSGYPDTSMACQFSRTWGGQNKTKNFKDRVLPSTYRGHNQGTHKQKNQNSYHKDHKCMFLHETSGASKVNALDLFPFVR